MDLRLSEDQRLIAASAADFLAEAAAMPATRAAAESAAGIDMQLWQGIADLGWCGVHLPESHGGLGLGLVELALLQEQLGMRLACVPFFDAVCAAALLHDAADDDDRSRWLPQLAQGGMRATVASDSGAATDARAQRDGAHWRVHGRWPRVGSAAQSQLLLLPALDDSGAAALFAVPHDAAGLQVRELATIDRTRRVAEVVADDVRLDAAACVARAAPLAQALSRHRCRSAIVLAAEQLGVAQQCLDLSVAYAKERVQFGRPIAAFQAVKHRCAQMMVAVESARSAVIGAAATVDGGALADAATLHQHASLALVEASDAALFCAQEAIQLHGGVGFTWEYDPHLYLKRAQANSQRLGASSNWLEQVAVLLLDEAAA